MAMQTGMETIYRVFVTMGCKCKMYAEFSDIKCAVPVTPITPDEDSPADAAPIAEKVFLPCKKHAADPALEMLKFVIEERLEEKVSDVGKTPVRPVHAPQAPSDVTLDGTSGASVQALNVRNLPKNGPRRDPLAIKRSGMLGGGDAGSSKTASSNEMEMDMDGVEEDERVTDLVGDTLGFLMEEDARDGADRR